MSIILKLQSRAGHRRLYRLAVSSRPSSTPTRRRIPQWQIPNSLVDLHVVLNVNRKPRPVKRARTVDAGLLPLKQLETPLRPLPFLPLSPNPFPGRHSRQLDANVKPGRNKWKSSSTTFLGTTSTWRGRLQRPVNSNAHLEGETPAPRQLQRP